MAKIIGFDLNSKKGKLFITAPNSSENELREELASSGYPDVGKLHSKIHDTYIFNILIQKDTSPPKSKKPSTRTRKPRVKKTTTNSDSNK